MSDVEKLHAFHSIKSYLSKEDQIALSEKIGLDTTTLERRTYGLSMEHDFFLILHVLKCCKHMLSFDEGTSVLSNSYSPDALIVLQDERKIFVEIKSKEDLEFKISGGNLKNRMDFALEFGYPLFFAVKLRGLWTLYSAEYLESKNGKLTVDDYINSEFDQIFNSNLYILPKKLQFVSEYSKTADSLGGISSPDGNLINYKIYFDDKMLYEINKKNEDEIALSMLLEIIHDEMSKQSQEKKVAENGNMIVTEKLVENTFIPDYYFLLSPMFHTTSDLGYLNDSTSFYKSLLADKGKFPFTMDYLNYVIELLKGLDIPIIRSKKVARI